ncbi:MAG: DUF4175 domain-containing protein [Paracoccus sp. (in: a-proteobacteria)]
MNDPKPSPRLSRALALTGAGLWWESLARAFWPFATLLLLMLAALGFGAVELVPDTARLWLGGGFALSLAGLLIRGFLRFRRPASDAALRRVDAALPGRPLSALADHPAMGGEGALWQAHLAQMSARAQAARAIAPDAGLPRRDPFGLRLVALTAFATAALFGSAGQIGQGLAALAPQRQAGGSGDSTAQGLGWEGWAEPPAYTRKPTIYLNDLAEGAGLDLPEGSTISLRLYGAAQAPEQDFGTALPGDDPRAPQFRVEHDGRLKIGAREIAVSVRPDDPPRIALGLAAERRADGRLIQPFSAGDDFGVVSGQAMVTLDMAGIERRFGLAVDPEAQPPLTLKLPLRGVGPEIEGQLTADLKKHVWANLPVEIRLNVEDGIGQSARSDALKMELPGRRFFDPYAAALIELRRDILWNRSNAPQAARLLRALIWRPEGFVDEPALDNLRAVIAGLESGQLSDAQRDALAEALWRVAIDLEDGGLNDALERMQRAQEKLSSAMRRGASPDEIRDLMEELRRATDDYLDRLAEQGEDPASRFDRSPRQSMDGDQIQEMMDEIQRLMNEGRMAEAQALLEQFNRMMENMQATEGGSGDGRGSNGRMSETLRDQQDLADRSFRKLQDEWLGQGEGLGQDPGAEPSDGESGQDLADQQAQLREDLGMQRSLLPERGTPEGQAAGEAMDRAGRAMREAEEALRSGDPSEALDRQAEAIEALRDGIRALDRGQRDSRQANAGESGDQGQQDGGTEGEATVPGDPGSGQRGLAGPQRDPLGRALPGGGGGGLSTDGTLAEGEDGGNRARELQDEIRRRLGERGRPQSERDYLDRLIAPF